MLSGGYFFGKYPLRLSEVVDTFSESIRYAYLESIRYAYLESIRYAYLESIRYAYLRYAYLAPVHPRSTDRP